MNLEPSLYESLRAKAYVERSTISAVINRLARESLEGPAPKPRARSKGARFPVSPGPTGGKLTNEMLARAEDEAEAPGRFLVHERP